MTRTLLLAMALFMMMIPLTASAFDGERKGFMLNIGAGFGQTYSAFGADNSTGFVTDLPVFDCCFVLHIVDAVAVVAFDRSSHEGDIFSWIIEWISALPAHTEHSEPMNASW